MCTKRLLHLAGGIWKEHIRRTGSHYDHLKCFRIHVCIFHCLLCCLDCQGSRIIFSGNSSFPNSGSAGNPFIIGIYDFCQIIICHNRLWYCTSCSYYSCSHFFTSIFKYFDYQSIIQQVYKEREHLSTQMLSFVFIYFFYFPG